MIPSATSTLIVAGWILITFSLFFPISFRFNFFLLLLLLSLFRLFIFGCFIIRKGPDEQKEEEEEEEEEELSLVVKRNPKYFQNQLNFLKTSFDDFKFNQRRIQLTLRSELN